MHFSGIQRRVCPQFFLKSCKKKKWKSELCPLSSFPAYDWTLIWTPLAASLPPPRPFVDSAAAPSLLPSPLILCDCPLPWWPADCTMRKHFITVRCWEQPKPAHTHTHTCERFERAGLVPVSLPRAHWACARESKLATASTRTRRATNQRLANVLGLMTQAARLPVLVDDDSVH